MSAAPVPVARCAARFLWWSAYWAVRSLISTLGWAFLYSSYSGLNPKSPNSPTVSVTLLVSEPLDPPQAVAPTPTSDSVSGRQNTDNSRDGQIHGNVNAEREKARGDG